MSYRNITSRYGACDRCRGQKLRCTGSDKPGLPSATSRFLKNAVPCDRCRRAKVDCYSVRPAQRRAQTTAMSPTMPVSDQPASPYTSKASSVFSRALSVAGNQHDGSLFSCSDLSDGPQSPMPSEWIASYIHQDQRGGDENLDIAISPILDDESNPTLCQDQLPVNMRDNHHYAVLDFMNPIDDDWNPVQIDVDTFPNSNSEPASGPSLPKACKLHTFDGSNDHRFSREFSQMDSSPSHTATPRSLSIHDLGKLHERLLREGSYHTRSWTHLSGEFDRAPNQPSIGHTLDHSQQFVSILKRMRYMRPLDDSGIGNKDARARQRISDDDGNAPSRGTVKDTPISTLQLPTLQLPTLFSILFCYTSILASYEDMFVSILDAVARPTPTIPATLDGLSIDGFELEGHNVLQLECLLNVSYMLLEKMERLLFGSTAVQDRDDNGVRGNGLVQDELAPCLVNMLVEANGRNDEGPAESQRAGKSQIRVKQLIREIQAALNKIDL